MAVVAMGLQAVERSPVNHKSSTLIRVIHFIIRLFVFLALSDMQHADGTEEDKKGKRMEMNADKTNALNSDGINKKHSMFPCKHESNTR